MKTLRVILVYMISAYFHLAHANSETQWNIYKGKARNGYTDSTVPYIENFGNGENKHNIVNINENSDRFSFSGTSISKDNGAPSVQKVNVDFNKPTYRGEPQDPNIYYNPKETRTHITNIGNGQGNKNLFVFNDNRNDPPRSRNNQDGNNSIEYRGKPNYGHQGNTRIIANIGRGPGNNNMIYVNGERIYPNAGPPAPISRNNQDGNNGYQLQSKYGHEDDAKVISNIGKGPGNNNMFYDNGKRVYPNPGRVAPVSRNNQNDNNGYRGETNYGHENDAWINANIGNGVDNRNMIYVNSEKVYPNAGTATGVHDRKAPKAYSSVLSDVSKYANDFGNGYQNTNRFFINSTDIINPNPVSNNVNIPNKQQTYERGTPAPISRNNQGNNGYQGQSSYGHQADARVVTNIGRGPGNNNMFYSNRYDNRVYPNSVNINGAEDNRRIVHKTLPSDKNVGVAGTNPNYNQPIDNNRVKIMNFFYTDFNDPLFKQLPMRD